MKKHTVILLIIIAIGIFLRLFGIWNFSFTHDELSVVGRLNFETFSDLMEKGVKTDCHPAGIQVFLWLWSKICGISEISLRLPFIIMGISCIPLMYVLTKKWFNATAGLFTSGVVAVSQYTIIYTSIARPYTAGLFFTLLLLIVWTNMVFEKDFRLKNIFLFGFFAAICAYIHQFSMLTAFLIAATGLFFVKREGFYKYIYACLIGVVLYAPHIPILLSQISMGTIEGPDGWLAPPTPRFTLYFLQYLFHFSWFAVLGSVIAIMLSSKINREIWNKNIIKMGVSLLLFFVPYAIGYLYSLYVFPVIQYSAFIFSFPFLLLSAASFIDSTINVRKYISLFLIAGVFIYSLVVTREHYKFLSLQWFEKSILKSMEWIDKQGEDNVDCLLDISANSLKYYEEKYGTSIPNKIEKHQRSDDFLFLQKIETLKGNFLVVAGLTDMQIEIVKHYYPVLLEYIPCANSEIYILAKTGTEIEGMQKINTEEYFWDTPIPAVQEFIPIKECNLSELSPSRFTKILLTLDYQDTDSIADYALVLQTSYKGTIADWRCIKPTDVCVKNGENYRIFLPLRYELMVKDSKRLPFYDVKIFLWNIGKKEAIHPVKCSISTYKSNPYIFGMVENLR